jgi:hypothetical protein
MNCDTLYLIRGTATIARIAAPDVVGARTRWAGYYAAEDLRNLDIGIQAVSPGLRTDQKVHPFTPYSVIAYAAAEGLGCGYPSCIHWPLSMLAT